MTAPGSCPLSTSLLNADVRWARRSGEKPTCSGRATGRGWPQTTAAERTSITETASASTFFMGAPPARSGWDGRDATSARWHGKPLEAPVRQIYAEHGPQLQARGQQIHAARQQLGDKLYSSTPPSTADLASINQLRDQMAQERLAIALAIRNVLTPDQLAKAAQIRQQMQ